MQRASQRFGILVRIAPVLALSFMHSSAMAADSSSLLRQGYAQLSSGNNAGAINTLVHAVALDRNNLAARQYLAEALMRNGLAAQSATQWQTLVAAQPSQILYLLGLAKAKFYCSDYQTSINAYKQVLSIDKNNKDAALGLASVYATTGHRQEAETVYNELARTHRSDAVLSHQIQQELTRLHEAPPEVGHSVGG